MSDELIHAKYLGARLPDVECYLVLVDEEAVGLVQLHTTGGDDPGIDLILTPAAQGHGTGRRVVEAMIRRARERNIDRLTVDPDAGNEDGVRFWRAVGFQPRATVTDDVGREPSVLMSRDVEPAGNEAAGRSDALTPASHTSRRQGPAAPIGVDADGIANTGH